MTARSQDAARRTVAVHPGSLGDVLLFGRVLERIEGRVKIAAGAEKANLLAGLGVVDEAVDFDALPLHKVYAADPADAGAPLLGPCDRLVSCFAQGDPSAELKLAALCGAASAAFLPVRPPGCFAGHLLDLWADLLGMDCDPAAALAWPVPAAWRGAAGEALAQAGLAGARPYVLIHPGSGGRAKCWPADRFVALADALRTGGAEAVFAIGPVEADVWPGEAIDALGARFPLLRCVPLDALAGALAAAGVYVGNDSGVSHLAGAVGTPTVALFGPTNPVHFAPLGPNVHVIATAGEIAAIPVQAVRQRVLGLIRP